MAFECECKHFRASLECKSECFRKLSENITLERDFDEIPYILVDAEDTLCLAEMEFGSEWSLIGNQFPMAIDFTSVFNSDGKLFLEVDENVSNVLLRERKLSLWALSLACHVQGQSLFRASGVAESCARIVVGTLRLEGHAARDLCVWPYLALEWFDGEDLILEEHWVIVHSFADALILSLESRNGLLLGPLSLELQFGVII